ncbi:hypothetical protein Nepgr_017544 [Nepenthes gracilis]|uniref:Uncharacterized protein n=1 Tax=Nepenthes gracilis TaxID=150966 RepID=A0AAD3XSK4_NEPGR|nr:hypothetical protein Nepgr_017544 [Nepenthes gracilis]
MMQAPMSVLGTTKGVALAGTRTERDWRFQTSDQFVRSGGKVVSLELLKAALCLGTHPTLSVAESGGKVVSLELMKAALCLGTHPALSVAEAFALTRVLAITWQQQSTSAKSFGGSQKR